MLYLILLTVVALDQASKLLILNWLQDGDSVPVIPFFNIVLTYNPGVSFSMFSNQHPHVLSAIMILISGGLLCWMTKEKDKWIQVSLALIVGGAIGNVIDRFLYGAVVDFLDVYVSIYHWPAFNVADSAICIGATLIIFRTLFFQKGNKK